MLVTPLAMPSVNWAPYIEAYKEQTGVSPTANIDKAGLSLDKSGAFLAALSPRESAPSALAGFQQLQRHLFFSFLIEADIPTLYNLATESPVKIHMLHREHDAGMIIASATLFDWRLATICISDSRDLMNVRKILGHVYIALCGAGLKDIWGDYSPQELRDGTTVWKRR